MTKDIDLKNPIHAAFTRGHEIRHGHALEAHLVSNDGELWHIVRTCCGGEQ